MKQNLNSVAKKARYEVRTQQRSCAVCTFVYIYFDLKNQELKSHTRLPKWCTAAHVWYTVEPCILEQIEHLCGPAVTKPMILLTKSSNMTLGRYIGLQHIQKSAS